MLPETQSILNGFLSKDAHKIWEASGAVRNCHNRDALREMAAQADKIRAATRDIELGGALRPNRTHLDFALRKIVFAAESDTCLCGLYLTDDLTDPVRLSKAGVLRIDAEVVHREESYTDYACTCTTCGREFRAQDVTGYHYIWWKWQAVDV